MYSHDIISGIGTYRAAVNPVRLNLLESLGGPLTFSKASGVWLEDSQRRRFLDLVAGFGAATLGHRHAEVLAALTTALESELPFNYPHSISSLAGDLAAKLCALAGRNLSKVYFGNSGAEGIEAALKFAMARTGKSKFLSFSGGFHGLTLGALSLTGGDEFRAPFPSLGVHARQVAFEDLGHLEQFLKTKSIAGVVVEVVQGMGGARSWKMENLEELSALCRRYDAMLIIDEVLTGIGRTGKWFAFQLASEGFEPNIVVVSKGLTGGVVPVCAVLMTDDVFQSVYDGIGHANIHASTFEGNLLAMTAGLAVIRIIERDDLLSKVTIWAEEFESRLANLLRQGIGILDVRVSGLLIGFQVADHLFRNETLWGAAGCRHHLLSRGVLVNLAGKAPSYNYLTPPFTISLSDIEFFFAQLEEVLLQGGERT